MDTDNRFKSDAMLEYLLKTLNGFVTGSRAWGVENKRGPPCRFNECQSEFIPSDVDIVVRQDYWKAQDISAFAESVGWEVTQGSPSHRGYKITCLPPVDYESTFNIIVLWGDEYKVWYLATQIMTFLCSLPHSEVLSPRFTTALYNKRFRCGFFEGLRALLKLVL